MSRLSKSHCTSVIQFSWRQQKTAKCVTVWTPCLPGINAYDIRQKWIVITGNWPMRMKMIVTILEVEFKPNINEVIDEIIDHGHVGLANI